MNVFEAVQAVMDGCVVTNTSKDFTTGKVFTYKLFLDPEYVGKTANIYDPLFNPIKFQVEGKVNIYDWQVLQADLLVNTYEILSKPMQPVGERTGLGKAAKKNKKKVH